MSDTPKSLPLSSLLKVPRQRRSVEMIHLILDAAIRVLQDEGIIGFNTNRVAEVAGVSVGTLYQYFGNKEMLVAGIVERGVLDSEVLLRENLLVMGDAGPRRVIEAGLRGILAQLQPYRVLLAEVFQVTPYASTTGVIPMLETRMSDVLRTWLITEGQAYQPVGGNVGIVLLTRAVVHLTLRHLSDPRPPDDALFIEAIVSFLSPGLRRRAQ